MEPEETAAAAGGMEPEDYDGLRLSNIRWEDAEDGEPAAGAAGRDPLISEDQSMEDWEA